MKNLGKVTIDAMWDRAWEVMDWLLNVLKVILILGGAFATSLADIALGTVTLSILLSNTGVFSIWWGKFIPLLLSLGSTGVQLILWQIVQRDGGIQKAWRTGLGSAAAIVAVILMKFADDFVDLTSVNVLMVNNDLLVILGGHWYTVLQWSVFLVVEVLAGFSELFVVNAVRLMRDVTNRNPDRRPQTPPARPRYNDAVMAQLPRNRR